MSNPRYPIRPDHRPATGLNDARSTTSHAAPRVADINGLRGTKPTRHLG